MIGLRLSITIINTAWEGGGGEGGGGGGGVTDLPSLRLGTSKQSS